MPEFIDLSLYPKLLDSLHQYVSGRVLLRPFYREFASLAWDAESSGDPRAEELASDVMHLIAEFSQGQWTEAQLHVKLGEVAGQQVLERIPGIAINRNFSGLTESYRSRSARDHQDLVDVGRIQLSVEYASSADRPASPQSSTAPLVAILAAD